MFRRLENESTAMLFPKEWTDNIKQVLLNLYGDKCIKDNRTFEIYAFTYPEEVLLIASYVGLDKNESPITLTISSDLNSESKSENLMNNMFDFIGIFFDHYFGQSLDQDNIFEDYIWEWEEEEFGGVKLFFKITRENIGLTLEANKLLGDF